ncbi:uncharacterized protein [Syngnathus scovelli]|uniref:uncharacterized protein isoform X5 n=1 Tax=Syngnathus scovelli TaxID=161590 RepID=UPI00210FD6E6|nr:uncharacterized protein LOC125975154 isoform X5 [Syngnathus scovelli]
MRFIRSLSCRPTIANCEQQPFLARRPPTFAVKLRREDKMFSLLLLLCSFLPHGGPASPISCYNDQGDAVDWFYMYKLPKMHGAASGLMYLLLDESSAGWTPGVGTINDTMGALGRTLAQLYWQTQAGVAYILYNDQDGLGHNHKGGHTKARPSFPRHDRRVATTSPTVVPLMDRTSCASASRWTTSTPSVSSCRSTRRTSMTATCRPSLQRRPQLCPPYAIKAVRWPHPPTAASRLHLKAAPPSSASPKELLSTATCTSHGWPPPCARTSWCSSGSTREASCHPTAARAGRCWTSRACPRAACRPIITARTTPSGPSAHGRRRRTVVGYAWVTSTATGPRKSGGAARFVSAAPPCGKRTAPLRSSVSPVGLRRSALLTANKAYITNHPLQISENI